MAAVMLQVIPSFYESYSKNSLCISPKTYEKNIVKKKSIMPTTMHDDRMCFPTTCSFHIILIKDIKELLRKFHAFCFNYQNEDSSCKLLKHRFCGKIVVKSGHFLDNMQRAFDFNHLSRGLDRMPSIAKKKLSRKKYKKPLLSSFQNVKMTQTSGSVFADGKEQVKKTEFELELTKRLRCFQDGLGENTNTLHSSKI